MNFNSCLRVRSFLTAIIISCAVAACQTTLPSETANENTTNWPVLETVDTRSAFSSEGLKALEDRMQQFVVDGQTAGISTLLVKDGEVVHYQKTGLRNPETGAAIEDDTIYRIYSMTKPVVGVAMMQLYEKGLFSLDDPIAKFFPEFTDLQVLGPKDEAGEYSLVALNRQPTMRELMSHTAGFAYGLGGSDPANTAFRENQILGSPDLDAFIDKVADVPLLFQPGTKWSYSAAVDIQGAMIERLTGKSLGDYLGSEIFTPLGMTDTGFYVPEADYERLSDVFGYHPETKQLIPYRAPLVAYKQETIAMESGGGGLASTMRDYARFLQMLTNGGNLGDATILQPETVELMRTNVLGENMGLGFDGGSSASETPGIGFGLNLGVVYDAEASVRPYGQGAYFWGGLAGTWFWVDPNRDFFFIGMIQRFEQNGPKVDFRGISGKYVYEALTP
jgi:CubicO group peptidase (beta-lactamase class C family)